jgi:hypothetical protein
MFRCCLIFSVVVCVCFGGFSFHAFSAEPKRMETSDYGNCVICHSDSKVLPESHVGTKGMTCKSCRNCHRGSTGSLYGKVPLSHYHLWSGVACGKCHGSVSQPKRPAANLCFTCHGNYQSVAKLTKNLAVNPHESHFGFIECGSCHKMHRKSELHCNKCHEFEMKVP